MADDDTAKGGGEVKNNSNPDENKPTVYGDYELVKPIGKGKFAVVYRAKRISDGEIVALKRINVDTIDDKARDKCLKEVKLLQSLDHPNVIKYLDSFITDNDLVIVVEWAAAGDLKRQLRKAQERGIGFEERVIWKYFSQMVNAMQHLRERRIMHRDLKPANIFLTLDGTVKIGDLGLSRELSEQTIQAHSKVGTPLYMSPEVLRGDGYDFKSDVWSLGCMLYELTMLKSPFKSEGLNLYSLFQKISHGDYSPLPENYSEELRNLAYVMIATKSEDRPEIGDVCVIANKMKKQTTEIYNIEKAKKQAMSASQKLDDDKQSRPVSAVNDDEAKVNNKIFPSDMKSDSKSSKNNIVIYPSFKNEIDKEDNNNTESKTENDYVSILHPKLNAHERKQKELSHKSEKKESSLAQKTPLLTTKSPPTTTKSSPTSGKSSSPSHPAIITPRNVTQDKISPPNQTTIQASLPSNLSASGEYSVDTMKQHTIILKESYSSESKRDSKDPPSITTNNNTTINNTAINNSKDNNDKINNNLPSSLKSKQVTKNNSNNNSNYTSKNSKSNNKNLDIPIKINKAISKPPPPTVVYGKTDKNNDNSIKNNNDKVKSSNIKKEIKYTDNKEDFDDKDRFIKSDNNILVGDMELDAFADQDQGLDNTVRKRSINDDRTKFKNTSSAFAIMDVLYGKLIVLGYPISGNKINNTKYVNKKSNNNENELLPFHFACDLNILGKVAGYVNENNKQPHQYFQFRLMTKVTIWLCDKLNDINVTSITSFADKIDLDNDTPSMVAKQLILAAQASGVSSTKLADITPSVLTVGYGEKVCQFLLVLIDQLIVSSKHKAEPLVRETPEQGNDAADIDKLDSDNEDIQETSVNIDDNVDDTNTSRVIDGSSVLAGSLILGNVDSNLWREETERVSVALITATNNNNNNNDGWVEHIKLMKDYTNKEIQLNSSTLNNSALILSNLKTLQHDLRSDLIDLKKCERSLNLKEEYIKLSNTYNTYYIEKNEIEEKLSLYSSNIEKYNEQILELDDKIEILNNQIQAKDGNGDGNETVSIYIYTT
jgi:NIMA (never in mitosis gene a)-related kinase